MGFTQEIFLFIFLPLTILMVFILELVKRKKIKNIILILLNLIFYGWASLDTLSFFLLYSVFVYIIGYVIFKLQKRNIGVGVFIITLLLLVPLCYCKYTSFFIEEINTILNTSYDLRNVLVPLGISFVTFESVSYVMDVYRGHVSPGSYTDFLLYLSFFPKLVSGPIVLYRDFFPQINNRKINISLVNIGIQKIIIGYAEKAILADTFGNQIVIINGYTAGNMDTLTLWLRGLLYFFELYFDFAGYSNIAIGVGNIMGFTIKENFDNPYISKAITEFWRRWHISLGTFFREYVYIPLGGNRKGNVYLNLFIVFLLTGIWHGANYTFILWGIIHGSFVVLERWMDRKNVMKKIPGVIRWISTCVILYFTWILFSSEDLNVAVDTFKAMFYGVESEIIVNFTWRFFCSRKIISLLFVASIVSFLPMFNYKKYFEGLFENTFGYIIKKVFFLMLLLIDILFIVNSTYSPFMYFQF